MQTVHPSAGVYTRETDLSARIRGVSSSIGVTVGEAPMGTVNKRVLITDTGELKSRFGAQNARNYGYMLYCANAFLGAANQLYVTRLVNGALTAGAYLTVDDPAASRPRLSLTNFDDGANNPRGMDDPMSNHDFERDAPDVESSMFFVCAENPGIWNNRLSVRVTPSNPRGVSVGSNHNVRHFYLEVFLDYKNVNSMPVEKFLVSRNFDDADPDRNSLYIEDVINTRSQYIRVRNNTQCPEYGVYHETFEFLDGGTDGDPVTSDQIAEAYDLYADPEELDVNILINSGYADPVVQRAMNAVAETRGDAVAILDVPDEHVEVASAINYRRNTLNLNSSYSALYGPWVQIRDTENNRKQFVPPSGLVAAAYASTDQRRALWFAPAGLERGQINVLGIRKKYNLGARSALDRAQINPIRFLPGRGYVIWGQETLQAHASATSNVNVRRLLNYIKKSISTASNTSVYEPHDEFLRMEISTAASGFLEPILNGRGLYDYRVICDETNNTPEMMAAGIVRLDVYADPVIPAKQIHLTAFVEPTGTYFEGG